MVKPLRPSASHIERIIMTDKEKMFHIALCLPNSVPVSNRWAYRSCCYTVLVLCKRKH